MTGDSTYPSINRLTLPEANIGLETVSGFDEYQFNALGTACPDCLAIDEQHFKVVDMMPGENAPPMHPFCRCSTSAYMDADEVFFKNC